MKYTPEQIKQSFCYREIYNSDIPDEELTEILDNLQFNLGEDVWFHGDLGSDLMNFFSWRTSKQGDQYWRVIWERIHE
jgi:hypothetical protein